MHDYLLVYDGKNNNYPELARVCGSDSLPDIISSGPDMLIEFQTSPYDSLYHPIPVSFLLGFEMQVEVSGGAGWSCAAAENRLHNNQKK